MKYTQEKMAYELGISISSYNQYEKGKRSIPDYIVKSIANILNVSESEIFMPKKYVINN